MQELARREFLEYCKYTIPDWKVGKHLELICNELDLLQKGLVKYQILIFSLPPQHGKSRCVTETFPSYYLGLHKKRHIIEVSYNEELASRFGRRNREKIEQYGDILFGIKLNSRTRSDTDFELSFTQGGMLSRGIMSGITGQTANLIIIDDPVKNREEADSETYRNKIWNEFESSIYTRLSAKGKIILIQTRWHEDDLAGRLLNPEYHFSDKVKLINIPCEAEEDDILGRAEGEALFPEIGKGNEWLQETKKAIDTRTWLAMFQGRPTAQTGNIFKRSWWQYYEKLPEAFEIMIQSWDCTFKGNDNNDYVVGQVWGKLKGNYYLVDQVREHLDFPQTLEAIKTMSAKYPKALIKLIEDKANGSAVISMLSSSISGIIPVNPQGGKEARANAIAPAVEAGNVYIPKNAAWKDDFIEECSSFPHGKHDDQVDSMSQGLNRLIYYSGTLPVNPTQQLPFAFRNEEPTGGYIEW